MAHDALHPDAQRVCDLIVAVNRPPMETLTPAEAREAYLAARKALQPDPEDVAEVLELRAEGPAGPIPLR
jgi:acetyl esterase